MSGKRVDHRVQTIKSIMTSRSSISIGYRIQPLHLAIASGYRFLVIAFASGHRFLVIAFNHCFWPLRLPITVDHRVIRPLSEVCTERGRSAVFANEPRWPARNPLSIVAYFQFTPRCIHDNDETRTFFVNKNYSQSFEWPRTADQSMAWTDCQLKYADLELSARTFSEWKLSSGANGANGLQWTVSINCIPLAFSWWQFQCVEYYSGNSQTSFSPEGWLQMQLLQYENQKLWNSDSVWLSLNRKLWLKKFKPSVSRIWWF